MSTVVTVPFDLGINVEDLAKVYFNRPVGSTLAAACDSLTSRYTEINARIESGKVAFCGEQFCDEVTKLLEKAAVLRRVFLHPDPEVQEHVYNLETLVDPHEKDEIIRRLGDLGKRAHSTAETILIPHIKMIDEYTDAASQALLRMEYPQAFDTWKHILEHQQEYPWVIALNAMLGVRNFPNRNSEVVEGVFNFTNRGKNELPATLNWTISWETLAALKYFDSRVSRSLADTLSSVLKWRKDRNHGDFKLRTHMDQRGGAAVKAVRKFAQIAPKEFSKHSFNAEANINRIVGSLERISLGHYGISRFLPTVQAQAILARADMQILRNVNEGTLWVQRFLDIPSRAARLIGKGLPPEEVLLAAADASQILFPIMEDKDKTILKDRALRLAAHVGHNSSVGRRMLELSNHLEPDQAAA